MFKIAQKHARFHAFSPFSASFYPLLHHNGKRCINGHIVYHHVTHSPYVHLYHKYNGSVDLHAATLAFH